MITLTDVTKTLGQVTVLRDVNFSAPVGKTTVLLGTSGSGKSTILRLILGLLTPDKGTVTFAGGPVDETTVTAIRHRTGYVLQEGGLFPHLSARDNVTLVARFLKWDTRAIQVRVEELAALVALPVTLLDRYPAELSGGQKQRVGLMRALMLDPGVLLMDEPLGALDPITRADLQRELAAIFARLNKTVVFVTHDLGEAAFLSDKVALMNAGRIVQEGRLEDLAGHPADPFVARFIHAQNVDWRSLKEGRA